MAYNQTGVAIVIKAFLPIGKTLDEQLEALTLVKTSHETGDYAALLAAAGIDEVKTEQKTRRVEDEPAQAEKEPEPEQPATMSADPLDAPAPTDDEDVPDFLKEGEAKPRRKKSA